MDDDNALLPQKDPETGRFLAGNSGFGGRPKGARNKLGEAFIQALHDSFEERGAAAIQKVIDEKPDQYLKIIASLCPKEFSLTVNNDAEELSDDEIRDRIRAFANRIAPFLSADGIADAGVEPQTVEAIATRIH